MTHIPGFKYPVQHHKAENRLRVELLIIVGLAFMFAGMIGGYLVNDKFTEINNVRVNACFVDGC